MKYHIESQDPFMELHIDADELITANHLDELDEDQFLDDFQNAIEKNADIDYLYNCVMEAYSDLMPEAYGSFDLNVVDKLVFHQANENLEKLRDTMILTITEYNESGKTIHKKEISYFEVVQSLLDYDHSDCGWYATLGSYIEDCLMGFERQSRWHFGLQKQNGQIEEDVSQWPAPYEEEGRYRWTTQGSKLKPIIWFGLSDTVPDSNWVLWTNNNSINNLWFLDSDWEVMEALIQNVNDSFLIWYTAECGCYAPNMNSILRECPVAVNAEDSAQIIADKIENFFLNQWKLQQKESF